MNTKLPLFKSFGAFHLVQMLCLSALTFCLSCGSNESSTSGSTSMDQGPKTQDQSAIAAAPEPTPFVAKDFLYACVDQLNIRATPDSKGVSITSVQSDDALEFTGERSKTTESIVLRGVLYEEFWVKVISPDQKTGWVYGGAVKRKTENKGNAIITDTKFDFPYFGNFDLSTWKKLPTTEREVGDASTITTSYQKGNQLIEIDKSDLGDYGYSRTYRLMDANKNMLKERAFRFIADGNFMEMTETVNDYTSNPARQYERKQIPKKYFTGLNANPEMVNGTWKEVPLEQ